MKQQKTLPPQVLAWWSLTGLVFLAAAFLTGVNWMLYTGFTLLITVFCYRTCLAWIEGDRKTVRSRLLYLGFALVAGIIARYYCNTA